MPDTKSLRKKILEFYRVNGRDLPWRRTKDPFAILVSEVMLQQTQIVRVIPKYTQFIDAFPDFQALASATPRKVLSVWQGLGYNRRALALRETAVIVVREFDGKLPRSRETLLSLPGIGSYTAGAIAAFAFNTPEVFIETNIRDVFIHEFFSRRRSVDDKEILPLIRATLDQRNPRRWYYALMDYGAWLKRNGSTFNRRSAHYQRQSPFEGSVRQIRGAVIRVLVRGGAKSSLQLSSELRVARKDLEVILQKLSRERLLKKVACKWRLA